MKRDPLAYYVSFYLHGEYSAGMWQWRKKYKDTCEPGTVPPDFPTFLKFCNEVLLHERCLEWTGERMCASIGALTFIYIWFFFKDPVKVLVKTDAELDEYFQSGRYRQEIYPVHFLRTEHLGQDLHDFLLQKGFSQDELAFILKQKTANVTRKDKSVPEYYSQELIEYVERKDRIYYCYFYEDNNQRE